LNPLPIKWLFKFSPHATSALALPGKNRLSKSCVEMNEKTSINSINPDLWPPQQPADYKVWLSQSSVSTRWCAEMFTNSKSDWWSLY